MPDKLGDRSLIRPGVVLTCIGSGSQSSAWITIARRHASVTAPSVPAGRAVGSTRDPYKSLARGHAQVARGVKQSRAHLGCTCRSTA